MIGVGQSNSIKLGLNAQKFIKFRLEAWLKLQGFGLEVCSVLKI